MIHNLMQMLVDGIGGLKPLEFKKTQLVHGLTAKNQEIIT